MTKLEHYDRVIQDVSQYAETIGISPDTVWRYVDRANQHIWKIVAPTKHEDFRKSVVLSHGGRVPIDWTFYAGQAWYTSGGREYSFHPVRPEQIAEQLTNTAGGAKAYFPGIYFEDQLVKTLPAGLTNITIWYFNRPVLMEGDAVASNTDDGMPSWVSRYVHMEAAQALREFSEDESKSLDTLFRRQKESLEVNAKLSNLLTFAMKADVRSTVKKA